VALINLQTSQRPKLTVTNIKSPIGKLSSGIGSFRPMRSLSSIFRKSTPNTAIDQSPNTSLGESLIETNRILVEIQNQLALDFANRISKESEEIKKIRVSSKKAKQAEAERSVEGKKVGSVIGKTFDKVVSPIKGIFGRLLGFFGWIGAGFLANKGIDWLSKNTDKVGKFFKTIVKNWQLIAGLVVGGIILKTVADLYFLFRSIRGLASALGLGRVFGGKSVKDRVARGEGTGGLSSRVKKPWWDTPKGGTALSNLNDSNSRFIAGKANFGDKIRLLRRGRIGVSGFFNQGFGKGQAGKLPSWLTKATKTDYSKIFPHLKGTSSGSSGAGALSKLKMPKWAGKFKGGGKLLGAVGLGLDAYSRKQAGQSNVQIGAGVGGGLAGSALVTTLAGMLLFPEPTTSVIGAIGLGILGMGGYLGGSAIADKLTGANKVNGNIDRGKELRKLAGGGTVNKMKDGSIKVLPPTLVGKDATQGDGLTPPPVNGASLPYVSAVDLSNEEVRRVSNMLGIFV